jgi:hypothetical protein
MKPRLFLQLGRAGDILNILPLCHLDAMTRATPHLMVAEPYMPLLDGVTYVKPISYPGRFEDLNGAFNVAQKIAKDYHLDLVPTQIYGERIGTAQLCTSFMRDSWRKVPGSPAWGSLPLVFDRRDKSRERGVIRQLRRNGTDRPYIVAALSGTSSPFPYVSEFMRYLRAQAGKHFEIIDVSGFVASRFYDLLGLLEGARALITIDSGLLHLAAAVPRLRVVAFVTREPSEWHGSPWRAQHVARYFYDEAPECFMSAVGNAMGAYETEPTIYHVWSHYGTIDPDTQRRIDFARETWKAEYDLSGGRWTPVEFCESDAKRNSALKPIEDPRPVAFMKDVIGKVGDAPITGPRPHDIIAFTNADVSFCPGLTGWILDIVTRHGAAFTHRWDFHEPLAVPFTNEGQVAKGEWYPGSDAFFFTVAWWRRHANEYPDMLVGREQNDEILRQLIKRRGGHEIRNAIYHEKHPSYWEHHGNREKNPGNQYNQRLARKWFLKTGLSPNDPWWWAIPSKLKG